jgi:molybdopterin/thiamine biosynthesis adenylyltransferase
MLNLDEKNRYFRQLILPDFGEKNQLKLKKAKVLVIGAGGLGSSAIFYLSASGVGTIGIVDNDSVEISNLQRQILHFTRDIGIKKTESAEKKLKNLNPNINIKTYQLFFDESTADEIIKDYDFVLDCTDNFDSKIFINSVCIKHKKPFCHAGILEYQGQIMTIIPNETACYKCVFSEQPPVNNSKAVIGVVPAIIGALQAGEAIKFILNLGDLLTDKILVYDFLRSDFRKINVKKNLRCEVCSN